MTASRARPNSPWYRSVAILSSTSPWCYTAIGIGCGVSLRGKKRYQSESLMGVGLWKPSIAGYRSLYEKRYLVLGSEVSVVSVTSIASETNRAAVRPKLPGFIPRVTQRSFQSVQVPSPPSCESAFTA